MITLIVGIAVLWLLVLVTGWCVFVAFLRIRALRDRERRTAMIGSGHLGVSAVDHDGFSDSEEAWRETVARERAKWTKQQETPSTWGRP